MLKWTSNTFKDILALKDGPVTYADSGRGNLKMENHPYPYSIKEEEFGVTWKTLNNMVGLMKTDYKIEDLSYEELTVNKLISLHSSH